MAQYIKSKSKTGKIPRTGNRYFGDYQEIVVDSSGVKERVFLLVGNKMVDGKQVKDVVPFSSPQAAKKAGWVVVEK